MIEARCRVCQRAEVWSDDGARSVRWPGGSRAPDGHPARAAIETLVASARGEVGAVVGPCVCGQPLVAAGGPPAPFEVVIEGGAFRWDGAALWWGEEVVSADEAEVRAARAYPSWSWSDLSPGTALFQGGLMTAALLPMALWMGAVGVVIVFYSHWASGGGSPGLP